MISTRRWCLIIAVPALLSGALAGMVTDPRWTRELPRGYSVPSAISPPVTTTPASIPTLATQVTRTQVVTVGPVRTGAVPTPPATERFTLPTTSAVVPTSATPSPTTSAEPSPTPSADPSVPPTTTVEPAPTTTIEPAP